MDKQWDLENAVVIDGTPRLPLAAQFGVAALLLAGVVFAAALVSPPGHTAGDAVESAAGSADLAHRNSSAEASASPPAAPTRKLAQTVVSLEPNDILLEAQREIERRAQQPPRRVAKQPVPNTDSSGAPEREGGDALGDAWLALLERAAR